MAGVPQCWYYDNTDLQARWLGWKARASLGEQQAPAPEPQGVPDRKAIKAAVDQWQGDNDVVMKLAAYSALLQMVAKFAAPEPQGVPEPAATADLRAELERVQAERDELRSRLVAICEMQKECYGDGIKTHLNLLGLCDAARAAIARTEGEAP
jgi:hypothetical protein